MVSRFFDPPNPYLRVADVDNAARTLNGVRITVPLFYISKAGHKEIVASLLDDSGRHTPCFISSLTADYNHIRDLLDPLSWFWILMCLAMGLNACMFMWIVRMTISVHRAKNKPVNQKMLQLLTLIPEAVVCVMRIIFATSPNGIFGIYPYILMRGRKAQSSTYSPLHCDGSVCIIADIHKLPRYTFSPPQKLSFQQNNICGKCDES
jgi:hypothetical protein